MNTQAIDNLYQRALSKGYDKSLDEFVTEIHTNPTAFYGVYKYATDNGYAKSDKDFAALIGMPDADNFDAKRSSFQAQLEEEKKNSLQTQEQPTPQPAPPTTTTAPTTAPTTIVPTQMEEDKDKGKKKKKSGTTVSPSAASSSVSPTPQPEPFKFQMPSGISEMRPVSESTGQRAPVPAAAQKPLAAAQPTAVSGFAAPVKTAQQQEEELKQSNKFLQEQIRKAKEEEKRLAPVYSSITQDINNVVSTQLMDAEEESVVPELTYQFGALGFKFEETGITGDFMKVTAPNGRTIEISLDNFNNAKSVAERDKLRQFLSFNTKNIENLDKVYERYKAEPKKFVNEEEFKASMDGMNKEYKSFENEVSALNNEKALLESQSSKLLSVDPSMRDAEWTLNWGKLTESQKAFEVKVNKLIDKENDLKKKASALDSSVSRYLSMKSEQGTWYDAAWNELLNGFGSISSAAANLVVDLEAEILPWEALMSKDEFMNQVISKAKSKGIDVPQFSMGVMKQREEFNNWFDSIDSDIRSDIENEIEDDVKKNVKYGKKDLETGERKDGIIDPIRSGLTTLYGAESTTPEWSQTAKEGFWGGALLGLVRSIPAMIGGSGAIGFTQRTAQMFAQGYDAINEEMTKNPEFENISESEKALVAVPIGIAAAALESIGLSNVISNKGLMNKIIMSSLGKAGKQTTAKTFGELVKNEVKSGLARGTLTIVGGALAEAETGAAQQLVDFAVKDIYNAAKGKEMFDTPDSFKEYVQDVALAGAQEAIGGFILGAPSAVSSAMRGQGFKGMDDNLFLAFEQAAKDDNMQSAFVAKLKTQVMNGETTMADAKKIFMDYRSAVGLLRQLPDNLSTEQKKESMNLLKEKRDLEESINGKDEALVKKQKDRIAEINSQLNTISENAVQEQATGEVSVQPTARVGEEVEGGKPEAKPEVVTTEGVKEEALTPQEQERKVALTEALKAPDQEKGTVTIGEEVMPVEDAQQELTALDEKVKPPVPEERKVELTEDPASIKERMINELGVDVQVNEDGTFEKPVAVEETPDSKSRIDNAIQQLTDAGYMPVSEQPAVEPSGISVSNKSQLDELDKRTTDSNKKRVIKAASVAINTLKSIFPNMDIVIHDTDDSYNSQMEPLRGVSGSVGNFAVMKNAQGDIVGGRIDINLNKANITTVAHEVAHAVMLKSFGDNPQLFKTFRDRISKILSDSNVKALDDFASMYSESSSHEEFLVELSATLSANQQQIPISVVQKIADLINKIVSRITGGKLQPFRDRVDTKELIDFLNTMSMAIATGAEITVSEEGRRADGSIGKAISISKAQVDAYHGSPYDFDRFTTEKIGTGEGAQAFGWGLYFTDVKDIAEGYAKALAKNLPTFNGKTLNILAIEKKFGKNKINSRTIDLLGRAIKSVDGIPAKQDLINYVNENTLSTDKEREEALSLIKSYEAPSKSSVYKVSLHQGKTPDQYTWLEWDKPVGDKLSKLDKKSLARLIVESSDIFNGLNPDDYVDSQFIKSQVDSIINANRGADAYNGLSKILGSDKAASLFLLENGIDGVKYPAESIARGATSESARGFNYVVFDENAVTIVSKAQKAREDIQKSIKDARDKGFSENAIKEFLINKGFTEQEAVSLMSKSDEGVTPSKISAPSVGRLFGTIKDVKKITMKEMDLLKKQLKDTARGARNAVAAFKKASQSVAKSVDQLASEGKITPKQATAVIKRFSRVNMFDDVSIDNFLNYISKTFENAAYADRINNIRGNLKGAKSNIGSKIGVSANLMPILNEMLSVDPTIVPDSVFDMYAKLVEMLGARQAVLNLDEISEVTTAANSVMDAINEQQSLIPELANRFDAFADKVVDDNGNLKYSETIEAMQDKGIISNNEAKLMKKFRKDISPVERNGGMTEQELSDEKDALISSIENASIETDGLPSRIERDNVRDFIRILRSFDLNRLNNTELKNLLRVIDNINNGYLPHYAQLIKERMEALNNQEVLDNSVKKAKPAPVSLFYERIKSLVTDRDAITELAKKSLGYIDQLFGDYKTKDIFNTLFKKIAQAKAAFDTDYNTIQKRLERVEQKIASSFNQDPDKTLMSKFKIMTYLIQQEYLSNPGSKQVNPVSEYLKKTIEHIRTNQSKYGAREANMLQEILNKYVNIEIGENEDGTPIFDTDMERLELSFNKAELDAIKEIRDINDGLTEKALYTAAVIRGDRINPLNNYIHLNTEGVDSPTDNFSSAATEYNNSRMPSTKAKSLIERTGKVVPLDFDVMASVSKGSRNLLIDYHMTEPIRVGRKTLSETRKSALKDKSFNDKQWRVFTAIENAFNEANDNVLSNTFLEDSFSNRVVNSISKQGYRAVLASVPRFFSELLSNVSYAIFRPLDFAAGFAYMKVFNSTDGVDIMKNLKSKQISRVYGRDPLTGKMIDQNILNSSSGISGGTASRNGFTNKLQQIYNLSLKKYKNVVELAADTLISTPDKITNRPIWFGTFANEFKSLTGLDPDMDKIKNNDEQYMNRYKDALDQATEKADNFSVFAGSTSNPYMSTLKGQVRPDQTTLSRVFNNFNNFMTGFMINEYHTARTAINAAMGNGTISRAEGIALTAAVTTRMAAYSVLYAVLQEEMLKLFSDEEEKEDEETMTQKVSKGLASAVTSLVFGRDFGNATRQIVNYGIENVNDKYLDFLRNGEYDQYTDNLQNTMLPVGEKSELKIDNVIASLMGSAGPSVRTAALIVKTYKGGEKKEEGAKERQEQTKNVRIPLEILGNLGFVPLYKDIRKIVVDNISKSIREEQAKEAESKEQKQQVKDILKAYGFESREDMKRYAPELYEMYFGEGSEIYEREEPERIMKRLKEKLERRIKDDMYDYVPKEKGKKGGFGAGGFGEKGGGFGSGGFGEGKSGFGSKGFGQ